MRIALAAFLATIQFAFAGIVISADAEAQSALRRLVAKNGESIELGPIYWVTNCRSIMVGLPEVEVLEGPPQVALTVKEAQVLPRRQGCAAKVSGGTLMLSTEGVTEPAEAKLTYRLKYKTKEGDRQTSSSFVVSLYP
jgi:hypothetical protein